MPQTVVSQVFSLENSNITFLGNHALFFSLHPIKWHVMSFCHITSDGNFDHLRLLFIIRIYGQKLWSHTNILILIQFSLTSFSIHWCLLPELLLWQLPNHHLSLLTILFIKQHSILRTFSAPHFFMHLCHYGPTDAWFV